MLIAPPPQHKAFRRVGSLSAGFWTPPGLIIRDSFTRADSAATLGSTETGQAWQTPGGTWGISSNQAYVAVSPSSLDYALVEAGTPNVSVQVKIAASGGSPGICLRYISNSNALLSNLTALFRRTSDANNSILTYSTAISVGDTLRLVCRGNTITAYRQAASTGDFTSIGSVTESQGNTSTLHGLRSSTNTALATRFDDFLLTAP